MSIVECRICPICNLFKPKSGYKSRRRAVCADCFCDKLTMKLNQEKHRVALLRQRIKDLKKTLEKRKANNNIMVVPDIKVVRGVNQDDPFYERIFINVNR